MDELGVFESFAGCVVRVAVGAESKIGDVKLEAFRSYMNL